MADFNVTECVIENVNGAAFLRPQKSYSIVIDTVSTTSSIPISANTQVVRLATPSSCHFRLGAGATTSDAMVPAGEVVDFAVQPDGGTSYLSVIEASSPTDIGGGGVGDSGLESVNVETLAGNKTITSTDARVQLLDPGVSDRDVTLDASLHVTGTLVYFQCTGASSGLVIKNSAGTELATLKYVYAHCRVIYNGSGWTFVEQPLMFQTGSRQYIGLRYGALSSGITSTAFGCGGSDAFVVTSSNLCYAASLGIGASPSSLFHVTAAGNANAFRVDNTTGRIGIGTGSPLWDVTMMTAAGPGFAMVNGLNEGFSFGPVHAANNVYFTTNVAFGYIWQPNATAKMWLTSGGSWGLGGTPSSLFHVTAAGNANALRVDDTTGQLGVGRAVVASTQIAIDTASGSVGTAWYESGYANVCGSISLASHRAFLSLYGSGTEYIRFDPISDSWIGALAIGKASGRAAGMLLDLDTSSLKNALGIPSLTTTERDALTPVKRMLIYNSTTDKFQGYNGAWVDLH